MQKITNKNMLDTKIKKNGPVIIFKKKIKFNLAR